MTFSHSFWRKLLSSHIAEAEKILNIMFNTETKPTKFYVSAQKIEDIIVIASQVITSKRQCAIFLMPLVTVAAKEKICKSILIDLALYAHDLSFSNQLLTALPDFENLSDLRRALLQELLTAEPNYQLVLQRWYVKNNTYHVKEMYQDFQAIGKEEMTLPMIKHFIQNKACSIEIDNELFPLIDGNYDIICDLARLDNKETLRRYAHLIPANNIEYKLALFYQFSSAFGADDYYKLFRNYIDAEQFYSQYQYIESLLKNPQALLETLGPMTQHLNIVQPSAPPLIPLATIATAVSATDHSTGMMAPIYAVAMPYPESLDVVHDAASQKESHQFNLPAEEPQMGAPELQEKPLVVQKLLLAFAKVSLEIITSPTAIMTLTRQLKNEWLAFHFVQNSIDLMHQWAKISVLFLEIYQNNGQISPQIMQFMKEDAEAPGKGFSAAWKSTMSTIGLSHNKYTHFYTAICSTNKVGTGAFNMNELVTEHRNVAIQLDKALQPS